MGCQRLGGQSAPPSLKQEGADGLYAEVVCLGGQSAPPSLKRFYGGFYEVAERQSRGAVRPPFIEAGRLTLSLDGR